MTGLTLATTSLALYVSVFAALISLLSLGFSMYSWRQANRPLITARVTTASSGNQAILLNLLVENTGNRPAKDIRLFVNSSDLTAALHPERPIDDVKDPERVFGPNNLVPVLANARSVSNAFGRLSHGPCTWRVGAHLPIKIAYRDLGGRTFKNAMLLVLHDDAGFAQTIWH